MSDLRSQINSLSAAEKAELLAAHDAWFPAKVQEALSDPRPAIPHRKVEAHFAKRRTAALHKAR
jgi:hypothetical protein